MVVPMMSRLHQPDNVDSYCANTDISIIMSRYEAGHAFGRDGISNIKLPSGKLQNVTLTPMLSLKIWHMIKPTPTYFRHLCVFQWGYNKLPPPVPSDEEC